MAQRLSLVHFVLHYLKTYFNPDQFFLSVVWVLLSKCCKNGFGTAMGLGDM